MLSRYIFSRSSRFTRLISSAENNTKNTKIIAFLEQCERQTVVYVVNNRELMLYQKDRDEITKADTPTQVFYKQKAFQKAIHVLANLQFTLEKPSQLSLIHTIGNGIKYRISTYLEENSTDETVKPTEDELKKRLVIAELRRVNGIGPLKAQSLYEAGCHSLADLKHPSFLALLSPNQVTALRYIDHLEKPIERTEAEEVEEFCRQSLPGFEFHLVGSYRRGAPTSSSIELMVLHPEHVVVPLPTQPFSPDVPRQRPKGESKSIHISVNVLKTNPLFRDVVPRLTDRGLLGNAVTMTDRMWHGCLRLPGPKDAWGDSGTRLWAIKNDEGEYRRVTFHLIPQKSKAAGFLALTGDALFYRHLRYLATKMEMYFNEYGLWKWYHTRTAESSPTNKQGDAVNDKDGFWGLVRAETEEDVFLALGTEYIEPEKRNFSFLAPNTKTGKTSRKSRSAKLQG